LPDLGRFLGWFWKLVENLAIAFNSDRNDFALTADNAPHHAVAHTRELAHGPAIHGQNPISRPQSSFICRAPFSHITDHRCSFGVADGTADEHYDHCKGQGEKKTE